MRISRVLLAGVAVAGVAATTSAFTASNTETVADIDQKAGYGELVVTGVEVTNVTYNPVASNASLLNTVVFTVTGDVSGQSAFLTLKNTVPTPNTVKSYSTCTETLSAPDTTITCTLADTPAFTSFNTVGLTVSHADTPAA